jgi:hypothetical protein
MIGAWVLDVLGNWTHKQDLYWTQILLNVIGLCWNGIILRGISDSFYQGTFATGLVIWPLLSSFMWNLVIYWLHLNFDLHSRPYLECSHYRRGQIKTWKLPFFQWILAQWPKVDQCLHFNTCQILICTFCQILAHCKCMPPCHEGHSDKS